METVSVLRLLLAANHSNEMNFFFFNARKAREVTHGNKSQLFTPSLLLGLLPIRTGESPYQVQNRPLPSDLRFPTFWLDGQRLQPPQL